MRKTQNNYRSNEDGFVLVASLLILLVLTLLGIAVNQNTTTEWQIAMNDRVHKEAFLNADAATELSSEVLEQSVACLGFGEDSSNDMKKGRRLSGSTTDYDVFIHAPALGFWRNYAIGGLIDPPTDGMDNDGSGDGIGDGWDCDTDGDGFGDAVALTYQCNKSGEKKVPSRQIVFPAVTLDATTIDLKATNSKPHSNITIGGNTRLKEGSAIQMAAGYEGIGKGGSGSGVVMLYDIKVEQVGQRNSMSTICIQYGLSPNTVGDCAYQ